MAQIFLSYAREDAAPATMLAQAIAEQGHDVWWDQHLRGGAHFSSEIDQALQAADIVIVLWSPAAIASPWVLDEAGEGRDTGRLLPVALDGCKPPLGFRQFQTIHMRTSATPCDTAVFKQIVDSIDSRAAGASSPALAPAQSRADNRESPSTLSICVLPFVNMSGDAEQEYFSDGITEDVITDLSKISTLEVIARNTAFTFKGQSVDVKQLAGTLGVSHVLEGSVRKAGERVRVTAQLIATSTAHHLWAERYDRNLDDIFAIQDEISQAIVEALQLKLRPKEKKAIEGRSTTDIAAYDLYLKARQLWISGNFGDARRCEEIVRLCRQAIDADPDYAHAWALMALAQAELRFWHGRDENALVAAERAIAIDPKLAEPHCVKARYLEEGGDYAEARSHIETALRLDPDSWEANSEAARMILREGKVREAIPLFEKAAAAMKSDHHSPSMLISCYNATGDREGLRRAAEMAVARAERVIATDPANGAAYASGADGLAVLGHADRAKKWVRKALNVDPGNLSMRYNLACSLASLLKEAEPAMDVLEPFAESVTSRSHVRLLELDPDWDSVRDTPRFQQLIARARKRVESLPKTAVPPEPTRTG